MTRSEMDASSKEGAERIARTIQQYWAHKGRMVRAWVISVTNPKQGKPPVWGVRTDMLNGLPRR